MNFGGGLIITIIILEHHRKVCRLSCKVRSSSSQRASLYSPYTADINLLKFLTTQVLFFFLYHHFVLASIRLRLIFMYRLSTHDYDIVNFVQFASELFSTFRT